MTETQARASLREALASLSEAAFRLSHDEQDREAAGAFDRAMSGIARHAFELREYPMYEMLWEGAEAYCLHSALAWTKRNPAQ